MVKLFDNVRHFLTFFLIAGGIRAPEMSQGLPRNANEARFVGKRKNNEACELLWRCLPQNKQSEVCFDDILGKRSNTGNGGPPRSGVAITLRRFLGGFCRITSELFRRFLSENEHSEVVATRVAGGEGGWDY